MANESGDLKLLGNFRKLIDFVSADTYYNPANADITKTALAIHYTASQASVDDVAAKQAPSKIAINDRQAAYDPLSGLVRRSFAMLKASGASKGVLDDAQTHLRKVTGARKAPKIKPNPVRTTSQLVELIVNENQIGVRLAILRFSMASPGGSKDAAKFGMRR